MGHSTSGLSGKAIIVTGAGRGIGEAITRLFAGEGALVTVTARTASEVERVVADITGLGGTAHGGAAAVPAARAVRG